MVYGMPNLPPNLKIALVHDYLREYGGAERVVEALHELFPQAPLYVSFVDQDAMGQQWKKFADWDIRQTWMSRVPLHRKLYSPLRLIAAKCFEDLDLHEFDVVISSSNAYFGKAVRVRPGALHICYCHTPPRSLYGYSTMSDWKQNPITHFIGTIINHFCRVIDARVSKRVGIYVANSEEVKRRIAKFYRRDAVVIHPPVNVSTRVPLPTKERLYYFYVNRLAFAKHPELAIQVCNELNLPLKVAGTGKAFAELKSLAGPSVEMLGEVSDEQLKELYAHAKALLYPVEDEDFGIVPVEAMSYGTPVIAHSSGGPKETIKDGVTGVFFDELNAEGLKKAIKLFEKEKISPIKIQEHAKQFSKSTFQTKILEVVKKNLQK